MKRVIIGEYKYNNEWQFTKHTDATISGYEIVADIVSPQKTNIELPLTMASDNDIIFVRDLETNKLEYSGKVETVENGTTSKISSYPFISIFDNDFIVDQLDGNVFNWIDTQLTRNFISTSDKLQALPLVVRNKLTSNVYFTLAIDTPNLFDILQDLFFKTGVYIDFDIDYTNGKPLTIYADVHCALQEDIIKIRYDNPLIIDKINYEFSLKDAYNKLIANVKNSEPLLTFYFYLKSDNTITQNANDTLRIMPVKAKQVTVALQDFEGTAQEILAQQVQALLKVANDELLGNVYEHKITFNFLSNNNYKWALYKRCNFITENKTYETYITKVEKNNEYYTITLGTLRTSLTDKIKKLESNATNSKTSSAVIGGGGTVEFANQQEVNDGVIANKAVAPNTLSIYLADNLATKVSTNLSIYTPINIDTATKSTATIYIDNNGSAQTITLQQIKNLNTKILSVDKVDDEINKLDIDDYIFVKKGE